MPNQDPMETSSLFSLSGIRERMKEKKNGALKTTKTNASIAAKIRTKAINNSSIIKVTLKQNNKALALALNAAKREAQELTQEKMLLQKEVKMGDFEKACLRQKLSAVVNRFVRMHHEHNKYIKELGQFMDSHLRAAVELSNPSERDSCSLLLSDGRFSKADMIDNRDDDSRPVRTLPKAMRIPVLQDNSKKRQNGTSNVAPTIQLTLPLQLPASAMGEPPNSKTNPAVEKSSSSSLTDEPLARKDQPSSEVNGAALELDLGATFGGNPSSIPPSSRSCSLSTVQNNIGQHSGITRSHSDWMAFSLGHVTERRKRTAGSSASFRDRSWMELSDIGPLGLKHPKEMESGEISQMDELVMPEAQKESDKKIKTCEAKVLKKMSTGTKGRDCPASKSKGNGGNCDEGAAPNITQPKAVGSSTMIVSKPAKVSAQVDCVEKIQPQNIHGKNEGNNSQCFHMTVDPSTTQVPSLYHEDNFSFSEDRGSKLQHAPQYCDKPGGCGKIMVDLAPWKSMSGRPSLIQEPISKAREVTFDPLSQSQSPKSVRLLGSPPSVISVLLDDAVSQGECGKLTPKVQGSSTIQNTTVLKTSSKCLEKTCGDRSQVTDLKREDLKPNENRKTHTENNVMGLSLDSHQVAKAAEGQKIPARSHVLPKTSAVFNKYNGKQVPSGGQEKTMQETSEEFSPDTAHHLNDSKILKDLTNATQTLCHSTHLEEPLIRQGKRARKPVSYEEPKLNRKLRRGDPFANSDLFSCSIYKTKKKNMTKS